MSRELPEVCKLIRPGFLNAIEADIKTYSPPNTPIHKEGMEMLHGLAKVCGYEKKGDTWVEFPKQKAAFFKVVAHGGEIVEEHGDGDLTVKTEDNTFIITTDGRIFREIQPLDR